MSAQPEAVEPPTRRRFRLTSVRGCRRELAAVYTEARNRGLDWQAAARAASVLQILTRMLEGGEIERRIEALEAALAGQQRRPRRNGHDHARRPELRP